MTNVRSKSINSELSRILVSNCGLELCGAKVDRVGLTNFPSFSISTKLQEIAIFKHAATATEKEAVK